MVSRVLARVEEPPIQDHVCATDEETGTEKVCPTATRQVLGGGFGARHTHAAAGGLRRWNGCWPGRAKSFAGGGVTRAARIRGLGIGVEKGLAWLSRNLGHKKRFCARHLLFGRGGRRVMAQRLYNCEGGCAPKGQTSFLLHCLSHPNGLCSDGQGRPRLRLRFSAFRSRIAQPRPSPL